MNVVNRAAEKGFAFWVLLFAGTAYFVPAEFTWVGPWITILLGVVMFGMGTTLSAGDFRLVLARPFPMLIGLAAQFVIMPLTAWAIAVSLALPPELAVGVILVGCCPGGTASNVITYMARGDVPLSVTVTSLSTLLAPVLTPFLLWLLAGSWLPVDPWQMVLSIVQVILLPILLGVLVRRFFPAGVKKAAASLPLVSVTAIVIIVAGVIALNADALGKAAFTVFLAVILHNGIGLGLGYAAARSLGLDEPKRRAISIEVGMQNSGLGVALALAHFSPAAALPSAVFSVWHNISGPLLATWWARRNRDMKAEPLPDGGSAQA